MNIGGSTFSAFLIAVPVWIATVIIIAAYLDTVDRLVAYMKTFHGPAWTRLRRRYPVFNNASWAPYRRPRKSRAVFEILWMWRTPLRDGALGSLRRRARWLAILVVFGVAASTIVFALFDGFSAR
jgi:hypothetical protein